MLNEHVQGLTFDLRSHKKTSVIEQPRLRNGGVPTDLPLEQRLAVQFCDM